MLLASKVDGSGQSVHDSLDSGGGMEVVPGVHSQDNLERNPTR